MQLSKMQCLILGVACIIGWIVSELYANEKYIVRCKLLEIMKLKKIKLLLGKSKNKLGKANENKRVVATYVQTICLLGGMLCGTESCRLATSNSGIGNIVL